MKGLLKLLEELRCAQRACEGLAAEMKDWGNVSWFGGKARGCKDAADRLEVVIRELTPPELPDEEEEAQEEGEDFFTINDLEAEYAFQRLVVTYPFEEVCLIGTNHLPYPLWLKREILKLRDIKVAVQGNR